jgi:hypothetical protein
MVNIDVERWSFWSPESTDPVLWLEHWQRPDAQPTEGSPPADHVPPIQRRRASRLSKMALSTALKVTAGEAVDYSIFCSQHGEIVRTRDILSSISAGVEMSPTAFAQSVHNTSSGIFTILESSNAPSMSLSSGASTFACGWLEAQAWLASHPGDRVLLVDFDEIVPDEYRGFSVLDDCDHALALILSCAEDGGIGMGAAPRIEETRLPLGPQFLAWLQSKDATLALAAERQGWQWER